ncbi:hypothetical protein BaRGS_00022931 [Batillaria attramentaria]|uniref:Secreted protein n=1 Tax=Batillaria attramentaria TaxID=370345 RepID=A0ABD0KF80_9CAEN
MRLTTGQLCLCRMVSIRAAGARGCVCVCECARALHCSEGLAPLQGLIINWKRSVAGLVKCDSPLIGTSCHCGDTLCVRRELIVKYRKVGWRPTRRNQHCSDGKEFP